MTLAPSNAITSVLRIGVSSRGQSAPPCRPSQRTGAVVGLTLMDGATGRLFPGTARCSRQRRGIGTKHCAALDFAPALRRTTGQ